MKYLVGITLLLPLLMSTNVQTMDMGPAKMVDKQDDYHLIDGLKNHIVECFKHSTMDNIIWCLSKLQAKFTEQAQKISSPVLKNKLKHELKDIIHGLEIEKTISRIYENPLEVIDNILDEIFHTPQDLDIKDESKSPAELDKDYFKFIAKTFGISSEDMISGEIDPAAFIKSFSKEKLNTADLTLPPGKYAMPGLFHTFWLQNQSAINLEEINPRGQGWKIHISALPHSAEKIANLLLPQIDKLPYQKGKNVSYKIIGSLPLMRTLWYIYGKVKGQESQPGKFLVIYPDNSAHAYELVKKIDTILMEAKDRGLLKNSDFLPLIGDAQVGHTGWVYVRYGRYTRGQVKKLDPMEVTMPIGEESSMMLFQEDDRFHPWPDFMNKKNKFWGGHPNPFQDLPLKWTPMGKRKAITWETRPKTWWDLEHTEEEKSELEQSARIFGKKASEEAIRQQIEADRLLAEKIHLEEVAKYEEEQRQIKEDEELARKLQEEFERGDDVK